MSKFVLTAQLQLQAPNNVGQVVQQMQRQLNNVNVDVQVQGAASAQKDLKNIKSSTDQATNSAHRMGKAFAVSIKRFAAFSIATRAVGLFTNTLGGAVSEAVDFERQLIKVAQVTGKTVSQLSDLTSEINRLSVGMGVASKSLLEVSRSLSQAGLSARDTKIALDSLAKTSLAPTFADITQTTEGAIAVMAQFKQGAAALEKQLGAINAVAGQFAVEAGDLISVIRRTGGVFKEAGGDLNELIGLFTSVRATTRESAESIATGLRTIFTRIQRPKTIEFMKKFGVELVGMDGKFVGAYEAVRRLSDAMRGLEQGDIRFIKIAEQLGGFRQIGKVIPLLKEFKVAEEARQAAMAGGDSLAKDAAQAQETLAVKLLKTKEAFLKLIRDVTQTTTFQVMANTALALADSLITIADAIKPLLPLLAALAAFKMAKAFGSFGSGLVTGIKNIGAQTKNGGGRIMAFSRGGHVPGTGNRDTVPAMLEPGEFVIKKSSAKQIGAKRLSKMNKYADGGPIRLRDRAIGGFFLDDNEGVATDKQVNHTMKITNPRTVARLSGKGGPAAMGSTGQMAYVGNLSENQQKEKGFLPQDAKGKIKVGADGRLQAPKGDGGRLIPVPSDKAIAAAYSADYSSDKIRGGEATNYKLTGLMKGHVATKKHLEGQADVLNAVNDATGDALEHSVLAAANAVKGLLSVGGSQPITPNVSAKQVASAAKGLANDSNAHSSTVGFVFEGLIQAISGAQMGGEQATFDFPASSVKANKAGLSNLFPGNLSELIKADAKRRVTKSNWDGIISKFQSELNAGDLEGLEGFTTHLASFAKGGMAGGSDTVPAMLTPGEFVVNRKSANRIGYGALNTMNKTGVSHYEAGGIVTQGRHFYGNLSGVGGRQGGLSNMGTSTPITRIDQEIKFYTDSMDRAKRSVETHEAEIEEDTRAMALLRKEIENLTRELVTSGGLDAPENAAGRGLLEAKEQRLATLGTGLEGGMIDPHKDPMYPQKAVSFEASKKGQHQAAVGRYHERAAKVTQLEQQRAGMVAESRRLPIAPGHETFQPRRQHALPITGAPQLHQIGMPQQATNLPALRGRQAGLPAGRGKGSGGIKAWDQMGNEIQAELMDASHDVERFGNDVRESSMGLERFHQLLMALIQMMGTQLKLEATEIQIGGQKLLTDQRLQQVEENLTQSMGKLQKETQESITQQEKTTEGGMGAMGMFIAVQSVLGMFNTTIEESDGFFTGLGKSTMKLGMTLLTAGFMVQQFGGSLFASGITGAFATMSTGLKALAGSATYGSGALMRLSNWADFLGPKLGAIGGKVWAGIAAITVSFYLLAGAFQREADKRKKAAIEEGNTRQAGSEAVNAANWGMVKVLGAAALAIGMIAGAMMPAVAPMVLAFGAIAAVAILVAKGLGILEPILNGLRNFLSIFGMAESTAAIKLRAEAEAQAVKATEALKNSMEHLTESMKEIKEGTRTATDALQDSELSNGLRQAGRSVELAGMSAAEDARGFWSKAWGVTKEAFTLGFADTGTSSSTARARRKTIGEIIRPGDPDEGGRTAAETRKLQEDAGITDEEVKAYRDSILEVIKAIDAETEMRAKAAREQIIAGKNADGKLITQTQFLADQINRFKDSGVWDSIDPLKQREIMKDINKEYENQLKAVIDNIKKLKAMNFGLGETEGVVALAGARLDNLSDAFDTGTVEVRGSLNKLTAVLESGASLNPQEMAAAMDEVNRELKSFGVDPRTANNLTNQFTALNTVQGLFRETANKFVESLDNVALAPEEFNIKLKEQLSQAMQNAGVSEKDSKLMMDRLGPLKPEDVEAIMAGNLGVLEEQFGEINEKLKEELELMSKIAELTEKVAAENAKRLEAEQKLFDAQRKATDLQLEAAKIAAKHGGKAVDAEKQREIALRRSNIGLSTSGLSALRTGGSGEIRRRNREIGLGIATINMAGMANVAGGRKFFGRGPAIDDAGRFSSQGQATEAREKALRQAQQEQLRTIKDLITAEEQHLKTIEEKNRLERESLKSLIDGDVEEFLKKQAAVGATAAIATGDSRLAGLFGADAMAGAFENLEKQKKAGVGTLFGQQIGGSGGLLERAGRASLASRGVDDPRMAALIAQTTGAEEASREEIRNLAGAMEETGMLGVGIAGVDVAKAEFNVQQATIVVGKAREEARVKTTARENIRQESIERANRIQAQAQEDLNNIQEDADTNLDRMAGDIENLTRRASTSGSIFTHDTHVESVLLRIERNGMGGGGGGGRGRRGGGGGGGGGGMPRIDANGNIIDDGGGYGGSVNIIPKMAAFMSAYPQMLNGKLGKPLQFIAKQMQGAARPFSAAATRTITNMQRGQGLLSSLRAGGRTGWQQMSRTRAGRWAGAASPHVANFGRGAMAGLRGTEAVAGRAGTWGRGATGWMRSLMGGGHLGAPGYASGWGSNIARFTGTRGLGGAIAGGAGRLRGAPAFMRNLFRGGAAGGGARSAAMGAMRGMAGWPGAMAQWAGRTPMMGMTGLPALGRGIAGGFGGNFLSRGAMGARGGFGGALGRIPGAAGWLAGKAGRGALNIGRGIGNIGMGLGRAGARTGQAAWTGGRALWAARAGAKGMPWNYSLGLREMAGRFGAGFYGGGLGEGAGRIQLPDKVYQSMRAQGRIRPGGRHFTGNVGGSTRHPAKFIPRAGRDFVGRASTIPTTSRISHGMGRGLRGTWLGRAIAGGKAGGVGRLGRFAASPIGGAINLARGIGAGAQYAPGAMGMGGWGATRMMGGAGFGIGAAGRFVGGGVANLGRGLHAGLRGGLGMAGYGQLAQRALLPMGVPGGYRAAVGAGRGAATGMPGMAGFLTGGALHHAGRWAGGGAANLGRGLAAGFGGAGLRGSGRGLQGVLGKTGTRIPHLLGYGAGRVGGLAAAPFRAMGQGIAGSRFGQWAGGAAKGGMQRFSAWRAARGTRPGMFSNIGAGYRAGRLGQFGGARAAQNIDAVRAMALQSPIPQKAAGMTGMWGQNVNMVDDMPLAMQRASTKMGALQKTAGGRFGMALGRGRAGLGRFGAGFGMGRGAQIAGRGLQGSARAAAQAEFMLARGGVTSMTGGMAKLGIGAGRLTGGIGSGARLAAKGLGKAVPLAGLGIGGWFGASEASKNRIEKHGGGRVGLLEGGILGALTGSASAGNSMLGSIFGAERGGKTDKTLGVLGAAGMGALGGAAIGGMFGGVGAVPGALVGAIVGAGAELYKISTQKDVKPTMEGGDPILEAAVTREVDSKAGTVFKEMSTDQTRLALAGVRGAGLPDPSTLSHEEMQAFQQAATQQQMAGGPAGVGAAAAGVAQAVDPEFMTQVVAQFGANIAKLSTSLDRFNQMLSANITELKNLKFQVALDTTKPLQITLGGTQFAKMLEASIKDELWREIASQMITGIGHDNNGDHVLNPSSMST